MSIDPIHRSANGRFGSLHEDPIQPIEQAKEMLAK